MPTYTFRRPSDGATTQRRLSFSEYDAVKSGDLQVTDDDGVVLEMVFNPGSASFILRDGPSGGWASKAIREKKYRQERSVEMKRREDAHVFKSRLVPNFEGQEASSWQEARDEARSKKGEAAAITYEPLVAKEKSK